MLFYYPESACNIILTIFYLEPLVTTLLGIRNNLSSLLTSFTDASYMSVKSFVRGNSLISNVTPLKLS